MSTGDADQSNAGPIAAAVASLPVLPSLPARTGNGFGPSTPHQVGAISATITPVITNFFDSTAHWLSGLPANPVSELMQGALLLLRRALLPGSTTVNPWPSTGQGTGTSAYMSDAELHAYLLTLAQQQYGGLFGQTVPQYAYGGPWYYDVAYVAGGGVAGGRGGTAPEPIVSGTNTQEDGVDEADFVETDGNMIYVAHNDGLTIMDRDLNVASQVALSGNVVGSFLSDGRLTVITQSGYGGWWGYGPMVKVADFAPFPAGNPQTTVTVYDVTDATTPTIASQTVFDGSYHDARAVDGTIYVVLDTPFNVPAPLYTDTPVEPGTIDDPVLDTDIAAIPARWAPWGGEVTAYRTYETWDDYVARVGDQIVTLSLPHAYSVDTEGNSVDLGPVTAANNIVRPHTDVQQSMVTMVSIDSATASTGSGFDDSIASMVPSYGSTVYMTSDALYLASTENHYSSTGSSSDTRIDRFTIDGTEMGWQASGVVSGTLINQFAMDEQDGYLHVATHTSSNQWTPDRPTRGQHGGTWSTRNDNGVYVLDTSGSVLDQVGQVTGLASGEQLYSVRFVGDKAYLVTFLQTDPLFVVDLSHPTAPALEGELVIPGFSNYLQPVGDGLLLGIGQERLPGSWNTHLHASLFDVSDGSNPIQIDRKYLDEDAQWSWSEAQFDHHALLYTPEDGLLVLPMAASGYDPETGAYRYAQLLKVLRVSATGIEEVGEIETTDPVIRVVRIDDVLYAVSDNGVKAYRLSDLSEITPV